MQEGNEREPSAELATITTYGPPYYDDRTWNPVDDHRDPRELPLYRALESCDATKIMRALTRHQKRYPETIKPVGKTRAFALDFIVSEDSWTMARELFVFDGG